MSFSFTATESTSFTLTHAKHMASKVAADLKRMQRLYGSPTDEKIAAFEGELIALLKGGYLETVTYGFKRDGKFIPPTLEYTARELFGLAADDNDPGRIPPGQNIEGASFYSFLSYNDAWQKLSDDERDAFKNGLPVSRGASAKPTANGYFSNDHTYSAGGRALGRASLRSYG